MGIYFVWPVAYNDVTDTYRLGRVGRLRTDLGGVYFNGIFSLALGGVYFLTGFEPLLLIIFLQHLLILYQFMPFLRLDGYYVVSDLTGVPDLFARIKPILRSLIPGKGMDRRVEALKPWVRVVVSVWVLTVIPVLLFIFTRLIVNAPQIYTTAWGSFLLHYKKIWGAFGDGEVVGGVASVVQVVLLVIPVAGMTLMFALVGKRMLLLGAGLVSLLGSTLWRGRREAARSTHRWQMLDWTRVLVKNLGVQVLSVLVITSGVLALTLGNNNQGTRLGPDQGNSHELVQEQQSEAEYVSRIGEIQAASVEAFLRSAEKLRQPDSLTAADIEEMEDSLVALRNYADQIEDLAPPEKYIDQHELFAAAVADLHGVAEIAYRLVTDPASATQSDYETYDLLVDRAKSGLQRSNEILGEDYETLEQSQGGSR